MFGVVQMWMSALRPVVSALMDGVKTSWEAMSVFVNWDTSPVTPKPTVSVRLLSAPIGLQTSNTNHEMLLGFRIAISMALEVLCS